MNNLISADTYYLSTECDCEYYDENDELVPAESCDGWCWTDAKDLLIDGINKWLERNNVEALEVKAERMNWNGVAGLTWLPSDAERIIELLTLDGDFRLEFYITSEALSARRWSHDEPVGTGLFTFTPVPASVLDELR